MKQPALSPVCPGLSLVGRLLAYGPHRLWSENLKPFATLYLGLSLRLTVVCWPWLVHKRHSQVFLGGEGTTVRYPCSCFVGVSLSQQHEKSNTVAKSSGWKLIHVEPGQHLYLSVSQKMLPDPYESWTNSQFLVWKGEILNIASSPAEPPVVLQTSILWSQVLCPLNPLLTPDDGKLC